MTLGQGARLVVQALYFTVIARGLGVANYGAFVGVVAFVALVYPFASAGRGNLLVQNVARDKSSFASMWGAALLACGVLGSLFIGLILCFYRFALPPSIPGLLVLLVAASDIIGLNLIVISGQAFQSFEQLRWTAAFYAMITAGRLLGALLLLSVRHSPTPLQWGYVYFGSTALVCSIACYLVCTKLGIPRLTIPGSWEEVREGFFFSISVSAQIIYNDIDKTMLARLSSLEATGIYGAAYRLIDVSFTPINALTTATYPILFKKGIDGLSSSWSYAKPLLFRASIYACLVVVVTWLCAPFVPYILGSEYAGTTDALRLLAPLCLLKAAHYFLSDSLTGAGYQWLRTCIQGGVALVNVLINLWLIPAYSWRGAAWSSLLCDGLLAIGVFSSYFVRCPAGKD